MKNANQIINTLQHKPQFSKLLSYRCIDKLDIDNIINTIKLILNSPVILESQKFVKK